MIQVILLFLVASYALSCDLQRAKNFSVIEVRSFEILVGWSLPSAADLKCVQGYRLCRKREDQRREQCTTVQNANLRKYTFTRLEGCQMYNLSVVAVGDNGTMSAKVFLSAGTAPEPENSLSVARKDNDTITVSWFTVFSEQNMCLEWFLLSVCDSLGHNCRDTTVRMLGSDYKVDLPKPPSCRSYVVGLALLDDRNHTSDVLRHVVDPEVIVVPENVTVTNVTSRSFSASWVIPASQLDCGYFVHTLARCGTGSDRYPRGTAYDKGHTSHTEWRDVEPCTECDLSVYFPVRNEMKSEGNPMNVTVKVYTLPEGDAIFDNATVLEATSHSVMVGWKATLPVGGQCVAAYSVCWVQEGDTSNSGCRNTTTNQNNLRVTGLMANTTYQLSLAALLHSGVRFGEMALEATTSSGQAGVLPNSLVGISTMILCLLTFSI